MTITRALMGSPASTPTTSMRPRIERGALHLHLVDRELRLPAMWLLERSDETFDIDPSSRQRRSDPAGMPRDLSVVEVAVHGGSSGSSRLALTFTDGHVRVFAEDDLVRWAGTGGDPEELPAPAPWPRSIEAPTIDWDDVVDSDATALRRVLGEFYRFGWFVITGTPTSPGALHDIAGCFGRVSATNFGALFDVESVPDPADLAYTPVALSPHTDQPYRRPTPGLQFLHVLRNDAPGGESIVVDGLAATEALRRVDPAGFALLCDVDVEFRYDVGHDVVVAHAPMIELDRDGSLRQIRFSPRLDFTPLLESDAFERFHTARRWLADWFDDARHQAEFKMAAGDVLVVDNHRVLHGRRPFDPVGGHRHLQGCYIDHDGPATMWRLMTRRLRNEDRG